MKRYIIAIWLLFTTSIVYSQETATTAGGEAKGADGSSSYTVGQVVYTTNTANSGSLAQGVQQAYEISTSVGIEVTEINLELVAYPNPTNSLLTLNIGNYNNEKLIYQLYDIQGMLLDSKQVVNSSTTINAQKLSVGTYLLNVLDNNTLIKTFRIIRN
jgi:hypothetical protein